MVGGKAGSITPACGQALVRLARKAATHYIQEGRKIEPEDTVGVFGEARGVFVTIQTYPRRELRGCIGYPLPTSPLAQATIENAINACSEDPRFNPVRLEELQRLVFEVSILSVPKKIEYGSKAQLPRLVKVGRDGLIVRHGQSSGLLLPQVPVEYCWDETEFISYTCEKAGLPFDFWLDYDVEVFSFQAQVFGESKPLGNVVQHRLEAKKKAEVK
ncbi:TIGR00296 family protein [Candidatus Parvarchaeota archaeon]|nr:TIGR00296 family protein [Candidatus Parvarchaeota archaeon]